MNELITVLIPAYNHERYVQDTIKSIINQTYPNIELIIINDGSTDSTWEKIAELEDECKKRFKSFHAVNKENGGIISSLNIGISMTTADYMYLIASDDMAKPQAIEKLYTIISKDPEIGLTVGDNEFIDEHGNRIYWDEKQNSVYDIQQASYTTFGQHLNAARDDFGTYSALFLDFNHIPNGYIIRTKAILDVGGYKEGMLEDYYMNLQIAKRYKMKYIDEILFSYRWHSANTVKKSDFISGIFRNTLKAEAFYAFFHCKKCRKRAFQMIRRSIKALFGFKRDQL